MVLLAAWTSRSHGAYWFSSGAYQRDCVFEGALSSWFLCSSSSFSWSTSSVNLSRSCSTAIRWHKIATCSRSTSRVTYDSTRHGGISCGSENFSTAVRICSGEDRRNSTMPELQIAVVANYIVS
jgi:hypothetical protein